MVQGSGHGENDEKSFNLDFTYLIALGANLTSSVGKPENTIRAALNSLIKHGAVIRALSSLYHTPAFPVGAGPDYVNAAAKISADWPPDVLLERLHQIEDAMGRTRTRRWGQRALDLDLLACGDLVLPDSTVYNRWRALPLTRQMEQTPDTLILPHPRLQDRAFVLVPLADVAPDWVHPVLGQSVVQMRDALPLADRQQVRPFDAPNAP